MADTEKRCWLYEDCSRVDCDKPFCIRRYKLDELYSMSLLSAKQRQRIGLQVDEDNTDLAEFIKLSEISKNIGSFVANGQNLYLHSSTCGNGKSSWAIRMIQEYFESIWLEAALGCRAMFISVPRFLLALKENITEKNDYVTFIKTHILEADLVVWDDIAAKVGTDFELNNLLSLIDSRIANGKSNIYTSNLNPQEIMSALGSRLQSRICNCSIDIELHGKDKRAIFNGGGSK